LKPRVLTVRAAERAGIFGSPMFNLLIKLAEGILGPSRTRACIVGRCRPSARTRNRDRVALLSVAGFVGLLPFFGGPEAPEKSIDHFVSLFLAQDVAGVQQLIHPDVREDKEIQAREVETFLKRFPTGSLKFEESVVDRRFSSEDGKAERFQVTLRFRGPQFSPQYSDASTLQMTLLWVLDNDKWWLERPLALNYLVTSTERFPSPAQLETATRFDAAMQILSKLGFPGQEDLELVEASTAGTATQQYKELEQLYKAERGTGGVDPNGRGVQLLLQAATRRQGGFLQIYHGDFKSGPDDKRMPVPWEMFRDYAEGAIKLAKYFERRENPKRAQTICRQLISLGRQFLDEPGGVQFTVWGLTFQRQGCQELARLLPSTERLSKEKARTVANLASRRIDLIQTALGCLDEMADYAALKTALTVLDLPRDDLFKPWAINTLAIFALKGAPANGEILKSAGAMVLVVNPDMQRMAVQTLDKLAAEPSGKMKSFINTQKEWVQHHKVYGSVSSFR
jgi:hypothetical protein